MNKLTKLESRALATFCGAVWFLVVTADRTIAVGYSPSHTKELPLISKQADEVAKIVLEKLEKL